MDDTGKKTDATKDRRKQDEAMPVTSLLEASLNALLRGTPTTSHSTLRSEGIGVQNGSFFDEFPRLANNLRPLLEAYCIAKGDVARTGRKRPSTSRPQTPRDTARRRAEMTYPCISGDIDGLVRSLTTVLEDMNRGQRAARLSRPSADPLEPKMMDVAKLTQCLSCDLCLRRLCHPYTSLICLHSFCYCCIKEAVKGEAGEKMCPVPGCGCMTTDGFQPTALGRFPLQGKHQCIVKDATLSALIEKLFGSEEMDAVDDDETDQGCLLPARDLETAWIDNVGPIRRIQAKQALQTPAIAESGICSSPPKIQKKSQRAPKYITLAVFPADGDPAHGLDDNYFHAPGCMRVYQFCLYLEQRFQLNQLELYCEKMAISESPYAEMTLIEARDEFWFPYHDDLEDVFTLFYRHCPLVNACP